MNSTAFLRKSICKYCLKQSTYGVGKAPKSMSTIATSKPKRFIAQTFLGIVAGGIAYDGFNEFKVYGGAQRFLRSLGIAAVISIDYSWSLYGVSEDSDEYNRVSVIITIKFKR